MNLSIYFCYIFIEFSIIFLDNCDRLKCTITFYFCKILHYTCALFSSNVIQVIHIVDNYLIRELYLYLILIILKNLVTWVTDDHRAVENVLTLLRISYSYSSNETFAM